MISDRIFVSSDSPHCLAKRWVETRTKGAVDHGRLPQPRRDCKLKLDLQGAGRPGEGSSRNRTWPVVNDLLEQSAKKVYAFEEILLRAKRVDCHLHLKCAKKPCGMGDVTNTMHVRVFHLL